MMYNRNIGRWLKLYRAMAFEFARFYAPQIKRLQRLIYMSAVLPKTTMQKYNFFVTWQIFFLNPKKNRIFAKKMTWKRKVVAMRNIFFN